MYVVNAVLNDGTKLREEYAERWDAEDAFMGLIRDKRIKSGRLSAADGKVTMLTLEPAS